MIMIMILVFAALALLAGVILLQVFLSKREGKWPGLVIPIISFLLGFAYPLNMAAPAQASASSVFQLLAVWLLGNIPTFIFLAIYFACRGRERRGRQMDKLNIQDLD